MADTVWNIKPAPPKDANVQEGVHPIVSTLLWQRGLRDEKAVAAFCDPQYDQDVHDPFLFTRMQDAVGRIVEALKGEEVIMIHGDYDADGICGTTVLWSALKEICARGGYDAFETDRVRTYLPDREGDGYGMSFGAVEQFAKEEVNLIITVDCGIANTDEIAKAYEAGMEVIVVDHHQLPEVLSDKAIIIHPLAPGESYPFKKLAAVGVAYKVASALYAHARSEGLEIPEGYEKWLMDLVAIATVTDMVPLIGENRTLETYGLVVLNKTKRPGLVALIEASGLKQGSIDTTDVGFRIGPRINAAGRIAHAKAALDVLLAEDLTQARSLAEALNEINTERQRITGASMRKAMKLSAEWEGRSFVAVVDESIRIGIAGLVAGKIAREVNRPTVVMTRVGEHFVGSGRAPDGFHFVEAMDACRDVMIGGGGHPQACGFTLAPDHVDTWIEKMEEQAQNMLGQDERPKELEIDAKVNLSDIDWDFLAAVQSMEPYGMGNTQPIFASTGLSVIAAERMGKTGSHLRLTVAGPDRVIRQTVGFSMGDWADALTLGSAVDIAYEVGINEWNGNREIQLRLTDIKTDGV